MEMTDNINDDEYGGALEMDESEEDALLEKGFENRHSIFLDRDGKKVHRYNFDDDEEEDILDLGMTEDLNLNEGDHQIESSAAKENIESANLRNEETFASNYPLQGNQKSPVISSNSTSVNELTSENVVTENVSSSTGGLEELSEPSSMDYDSGRFKATNSSLANKSVTTNPSGSVPIPRLQLFTKELKNRQQPNSNIKKRLGNIVRHPAARIRHPRFGNPNFAADERMMRPPHFRNAGPQFRPPGPPPAHLRGQWPRKILLNPHFNQNNQNQSWQTPQWQEPQWSAPPQHQPVQQQYPAQHPPEQSFQPLHPSQQPRFPGNMPPAGYVRREEQSSAWNPNEHPPPFHREEQQPAFVNQPSYQPEFGGYQQVPSHPQVPPPGPQPPHQNHPYLNQQHFSKPRVPPPLQTYPEQRLPPSQQIRNLEPAAPPGYGFQNQPYSDQYESDVQIIHQQSQPPMRSNVEVINLESIEDPSHPQPLGSNYPPAPQVTYNADDPSQFPRSYNEPLQYNNPRLLPPENQYHVPVPPNASFRPECRPPPFKYERDRNDYFGPGHSAQNYSYETSMPRNDQFIGRSEDPFESEMDPQGSYPPQHQVPLETNQFEFGEQAPNQNPAPYNPPVVPARQKGSIKSRLGARVTSVAEVKAEGSNRQTPHQGNQISFNAQNSLKRNLGPVPVANSPNKQSRYDHSISKKSCTRNLHEVQTVSNLPDTTTTCEKEVPEINEEDEEMKEYRKKIEKQKQFRQQIFEIKEARRKQAVLQQQKAAPESSGPTLSGAPEKVVEVSKAEQPIATIISGGGNKQKGILKKSVKPLEADKPMMINSDLLKRAIRFSQPPKTQPQKIGNIVRSNNSRDLINFNEPFKKLNVCLNDGKITVKSKSDIEIKPGPRSVILPDTTGTESKSVIKKDVDVGTSKVQKTVSSQPLTLDERFSNLSSNSKTQTNEEKFPSNSNRTVLPATEDSNGSNIVIIDNLSASTKAQQLVKMASQCGKLAELNLKQSQKQAILKFKSPAGAAEFYKKYQRKMIDLSMITLSMGPV